MAVRFRPPSVTPSPLRVAPGARFAAIFCLALAVMPGAWASTDTAAVRFQVPGGPLAWVLLEIARAGDAVISFDPELVRDLVARPIEGAMTVGEALEHALSGSRLTAVVTEAGVWALRSRSDSAEASPHVLGEVHVVARAENQGGGLVADLPRTATPHAALPSDTPVAVSAISRAVIERQQPASLADVLLNAGASPIYDGTHNHAMSFRIRGLRSQGRMLDGLYETGDQPVPLEGIEQIDVVKGPADVTRGHLTGSGAINLLTRRPGFDASRRVSLLVSDDGARRAAADLTGPIGGERRWAYRLDALAQRSVLSGQRRAAPLEDYVAPVLRHRDADGDFVAGVQHYRRRPTILPFTVGMQRRPERLPRRLSDLVDEDRTDVSTRAYYVSERSIGTDWRWDSRGSVTRHQTRARFAIPEYVDEDMIVVLTRPLDVRRRSVTLANELSRTFDTGSTLTSIAVGADWTSTWQDWCICGPIEATVVDPRTATVELREEVDSADNHSVHRLRSIGLYLLGHTSVGDRLHLQGSVRRSSTESRHEQLSFSLFGMEPSRRDAAWSHSLGISYRLVPQVAAYANWTRGVNSVPEGITAAGRSVPAENVRQTEVGLKFSTQDLRLEATVAAFRTVSDYTIAPDTLYPGLFVTLPGQTIKGFEAEVVGEPGRGWEIAGNFTWLDARLHNEWTTVPALPGHVGRLWTRYGLQGDHLGGWAASVGVTTVGKTLASVDGEARVPGHTQVDLGVSYRQPDWSVDLAVKNATNRLMYGPSISYLRIPILPSRTVILSARFAF